MRPRRILSPAFLYGSAVPGQELLTTGRLPNLVLGAALIGLIGWWSYRLWGPWAALLALSLAAFEPNLVANSSLITMDVGITLFTFAACYLLWEYVHQPTGPRLAAVGIALGLAFVSKFSCLLTLVILLVVIALHLLEGGTLGQSSSDHLWRRVRQAVRPG